MSYVTFICDCKVIQKRRERRGLFAAKERRGEKPVRKRRLSLKGVVSTRSKVEAAPRSMQTTELEFEDNPVTDVTQAAAASTNDDDEDIASN